MAWYEDGKLRFALGFEDTFVPDSRAGARPLDEYALTEHYGRWSEDLDLLAGSGAHQARWGVPWYKVNPEPGRYEFGWLDRVVAKMVASGVEPILDLVHYGTPRWMDNAFLNSDYPARVTEYAATVAARYADLVRLYTPVNEPVVTAERCGEQGAWPPALVGADGFVKVLAQVARGAVLSQHAMAQAGPSDICFVHVEATRYYGGDRARYPEAVAQLGQREFLHLDLITGRLGGDHPMRPYLQRHGVSDADLTWFVEHQVHPDVLGINYYPHVSTVDVSDTGPVAAPERWGVRPGGVDGLVDTLRRWDVRYPYPLYLTETCDPGDVDRRVQWLQQSVETVVRLRDQGMNLVGYTWWSLFDMVLWDYREGTGEVRDYLLGHGLWDLEWDEFSGFERVRTAAADVFRDLARLHGGSAAVSARTNHESGV